MASSYLELDAAQAEEHAQRIVQFHEWHRRSEVPAYARLMRSASERAARGITTEDVAWGLESVRSRYRKFASKRRGRGTGARDPRSRADHGARAQVRDNNEKFEKEFLPADRASAGARSEAQLERFRDFAGELTVDQEARIELFALAHERHVALRFEDRRNLQHDLVAAIKTHHQTQSWARRSPRSSPGRSGGAPRRSSARTGPGRRAGAAHRRARPVAVSQAARPRVGAFRTTQRFSRRSPGKRRRRMMSRGCALPWRSRRRHRVGGGRTMKP